MQNIKYGIESSKHGESTIFVYKQNGEKVYLHSKYDPLKEANALKDRFIPEKYDAVIMLGAGLGYHLIPLIKLGDKYTRIIIIDIIKNIETEIKKNKNTNSLLKSENVLFLTGMNIEQLESKLSHELDFDLIKGIDVIEHTPSTHAFAEYYKQTKETVKRIIDKKAGDKATHKAFAMLYLRNIIKNYNSFQSLYPVSAFYGKMKEYSCLVITSGPSLENYIEKIKNHQDKIFIITVDSALKILAAYGIEPDFFISIDPQPFIFEHLFGMKISRTLPIFTVSTHSLAIQEYINSQSVLSLNSHPFSQIIEDMFPNIIGSIDSKTGTVAGDAVMASQRLGFYNTGLIGFDFSFPDFKIYPRGTAYQNRFNNISSRLNTSETNNFNYIMKSSKGMKYENKFTRKSFMLYRESFQRLLTSYKTGIFNINHKGISFGVPYMNLDSFLDTYCKVQIDKKKIIDKIIRKTAVLKDSINFKMVENALNSEAIFREFINASLNTEIDDNFNTIKQLFKSMKTGRHTE